MLCSWLDALLVLIHDVSLKLLQAGRWSSDHEELLSDIRLWGTFRGTMLLLQKSVLSNWPNGQLLVVAYCIPDFLLWGSLLWAVDTLSITGLPVGATWEEREEKMGRGWHSMNVCKHWMSWVFVIVRKELTPLMEHATSTVRHDLTTVKQSNFALRIGWYLQTPPLFLSSLALPLL